MGIQNLTKAPRHQLGGGTIKDECDICKRDIKVTALASAHECADQDCSAKIHIKCDILGVVFPTYIGNIHLDIRWNGSAQTTVQVC